MSGINTALLEWVHNLTSCLSFKASKDSTVSELVYSSWPIVDRETPKTELKLSLADVEKLAKNHLIQNLTIRFSHDGSGLIRKEYICKVYQDGTGSIIRTLTKLTNFANEICEQGQREAPIVQKTGRGGTLPTMLIEELDSRQTVFMPQFLNDAIHFLEENDYFNILVYPNGTNAGKPIGIDSDNKKWLKMLDTELRKLQLDPNEITIAAERQPNSTDHESISLTTNSKRRMAYMRSIIRDGKPRRFEQAADTLPLGLFSDFAHTHFAKPTNDAFIHHIYHVCDSMYTHPIQSVAMF